MAHAADEVAAAFRRQATACGLFGSPLWERLLDAMASDLDAHGPTWALVHEWDGDLDHGALPLRVAGGLHYLALAGQAPALARTLPSCGGTPDPDRLWAIARDVLVNQVDALRPFLDSPPQTNEVGRCCVLMPGMLAVARATGLPLRPREIGSSAGLNQCWDLYAYRLGDAVWNEGGSALALETEWHGDPPPRGPMPVVTSRAGCDLNPLDIRRDDVRLRLQAYVWPEQARRLANLRAAIDVARANDVEVEHMPASRWVARELRERPAGECIVVYHSIVRQYFSDDEGRAFDDAIAGAGAAATTDRPVAWLRLEQEALHRPFELRLSLWPRGETRVLGTAHPHGAMVMWGGSSSVAS